MANCLTLKKSNCKSCFRCVRKCPIKAIRFSGNQAHIISNECILCGNCVVQCPQNAKQIVDGTERVKVLIQSDAPVVVSLAPSFVANYEGAGISAMRKALTKLGFHSVEETAIGATIVKNEYERMLREDERDPMRTSTFGFGEMLAEAIGKGYRDFIVGIGGSATNDGGFGMLRALGFEFLDRGGKPIALGAGGLRDLCYIKTENAMKALSDCRFSVACDVKNPLCGENGCSAVFAPQKGASPDAVREMDGLLARYAELTAALFGKDLSSDEGSGAAGGLGFAFLSYLNASLRSGAQTVIEATSLERKIMEADILITGEGKLDMQSFMGKAPVEAARIAKKYGKKVIVFAGAVSDSACQGDDSVIDAFFSIVSGPCTLAEAMDKEQARKNMSRAAEQAFRLLKAFSS